MLLGLLSLLLPLHAHQVQTTDTVGATLHLEPDDNPRAGEETEVWFALTQAGGVMIPLHDCLCRLEVLAMPTLDVLATPDLVPVDAERYKEIPGATVLFPRVGAYQLRLVGEPVAEAAFDAFDLTFEVIVAR
ncbi:MAG: hypothetical protein HC926_01055 [Synechococcaceae cyanobacterium SM2_3_60]|nr:hypothetical protein [Synechococcaceae cyanobacterium SM2_3_60]